MTDEQINKAIAKALGLKIEIERITRRGNPDQNRVQLWCLIEPHGWRRLPNYCNDLNAMHEAEKTLTDANMFVMAHHIERLASAHGQHYFHATARQRAEAFLRTIGRWEK
jgi:hypothetical protein